MTRRVKARPEVGKGGASFKKHLSLALNHFHDPDWLGLNSPVAASYFLGKQLTRHPFDRSPNARGRVLQGLLKQAIEDLTHKGVEGRYAQQLLDLRFVNGRSLDYVFDTLHIGRSTYYRHEAKAIDLLANAFIQRVNPAIRLEFPAATRRLFGREILLRQIHQAVDNNCTVTLLGKSGVGKTSLGVQLMAEWQPRASFWYSFKIGLNDRLSSLLFSLSYFLSGCGSSNLWLQLIADQTQTSLSVASALLLYDLEALGANRPLLCFDDVDLLNPEESDAHAQLVSFLSGLRLRVPILLISQLSQSMIESDKEFTIPNLDRGSVSSFFTQSGISLSDDELNSVLGHTDGNPRLLSLLTSLHRSGESLAQALATLTHAPSAESLVVNILRHLLPAERKMLKGLAVFYQDAPADAWDSRTLQTLISRGLVQESAAGGVALPTVIRATLLSKIPPEEREMYHLLAAQIAEARAEYTTAAYHYTQAGQPRLALQLWRAYKQQEIEQGKAAEALNIFETMSLTPLRQPERELLVLTRSELKMLLGELEQSAGDLDGIEWSQDSLWRLLAHELRGSLALARNQLDIAADELSTGLQSMVRLSTLTISMHRNLATVLRRGGDYEHAWEELLLAQCEVSNAQGFLKFLMGDFQAAQSYLTTTLLMAQAQSFNALEAKVRSNYGEVLKVLADFEAATYHLKLAIRYYEASGDLLNTAFVKSNLAAVYVEAKRPQEALAPAGDAFHLCQEMRIPVGIARAAQVLAEAHLLLSELDQADYYARRVVEEGLATYLPYGLVTQAEVRVRRGDFETAERICHQSLHRARALGDRNIEAHGLRILGMAYAGLNQRHKAESAFRDAIEAFEGLKLPQEAAVTRELSKPL